MNKYTRLFVEESRAYLPGLAAIISRLRDGSPREGDLREAQRLAHSIKGMALFEEQPGIAALSWAMEQGFERLTGNGAGGALLAGLEEAVPVLLRMIDEVEAGGAPGADPRGLAARIEAVL